MLRLAVSLANPNRTASINSLAIYFLNGFCSFSGYHKYILSEAGCGGAIGDSPLGFL